MTDEDFEDEEAEEEGSIPDSMRYFSQMARACRSRVRRGKDAVVAFTGDEGIGKSTAAMQFSRLADKRFNSPENLKTHVLFDPDIKMLYDRVYHLPVMSPVIVDEFFRVGYKRNWYEKANKLLVEMYALCRKQRKISIFCIPRFNQIDNDMRPRILFWVHIIEEGVGVVLRRDKNQFSSDPWNFRENEKLLREALRYRPVHDATVEEYVEALAKSKNFVGVVQFEDLPKEWKTEYDSLSKPYELRGLEKQESSLEKKYREALGKSVGELFRQGFNARKVEELTGLGYATVYNLLKGVGLSASELHSEFKAKKMLDRPPEKFDEVPTVLDVGKDGLA